MNNYTFPQTNNYTLMHMQEKNIKMISASPIPLYYNNNSSQSPFASSAIESNNPSLDDAVLLLAVYSLVNVLLPSNSNNDILNKKMSRVQNVVIGLRQFSSFIFANKTNFVPSPWVVILLTVLGLAYFAFAIYVYKKHQAHFGGQRLSRNNEKCASYSKLDPPNVRGWESYGEEQQNHMECSHTLHPDLFKTRGNENYNSKREDMKRRRAASDLDMDHVYVSYLQLLWAFTFVGPFSYLLWKKATFFLKWRIYLVRVGLLEKKTVVDYDSLVCKIILEQSQVIHYVGQSRRMNEKNGEMCSMAEFCFPSK